MGIYKFLITVCTRFEFFAPLVTIGSQNETATEWDLLCRIAGQALSCTPSDRRSAWNDQAILLTALQHGQAQAAPAAYAGPFAESDFNQGWCGLTREVQPCSLSPRLGPLSPNKNSAAFSCCLRLQDILQTSAP